MNIDELIKSIKFGYGNVNYVALSGDRKLQNLSSKLYKLWYSYERISIATIDMYANRVLDISYPEYTADVFVKEALELKEALVHEFAQIIKKGGIEDERASSIQ